MRLFIINRAVEFPEECLRRRLTRDQVADAIETAGSAVTFVATGLEQMLLCRALGVAEGRHYTGTACRLPEFLPGDKVLVLDLDRNGKSYLYDVKASFGEPKLILPSPRGALRHKVRVEE